MATFIAVYSGQTVCSARLIEVSAEPALVEAVAAHLLKKGLPADPAQAALDRGRRAALRAAKREAGRVGKRAGLFKVVELGAAPDEEARP